MKQLQTTQSEVILSILYTAETNDELVRRIQDIILETGWYDGLAGAVLIELDSALKVEKAIGDERSV